MAALAPPTPARSQASAPACDRACLESLADRYVAAMLAKDSRPLPWAPLVKFTENNVALKIGDGLWGTITAAGPAVLKIADPKTGQVGWFGAVNERGVDSVYAVRLKVRGGRIAEVESIVSRKAVLGPGPYGDPAALTHDPLFQTDEPAAVRRPRAQLVALVNGYFDTLQRNDGTIRTQFDDGCIRWENGARLAGDPDPGSGTRHLNCRQQFATGFYRWDDRVRDRRYLLVDEDRQLVMSAVFIDHSGKLTDYSLTTGEKKVSPMKAPHDWCVLEVFKIKGGKLARIEAVFIPVPYRMASPWVLDGAPTLDRLP